MAFINSIMEDVFRCFLFYACNPREKKEFLTVIHSIQGVEVNSHYKA